MNNVDDFLYQSIDDLLRSKQEATANIVIDSGCYICPVKVTHQNTGKIEQYIIIDFQKPMLYDFQEYKGHGLYLFDMFNDIEHWYNS